MAPPGKTVPVAEHTIDRTPEHEEFINKLREFHAQRGTKFDPEPKVGYGQIDLYKVFNHVVKYGGYDKVSDAKLLWRHVALELGMTSHNLDSIGFNLKTAYYKNLAAYEIRTIHNKTPPPPEILEDLTAKGSGLLTRTLENFRPRDRSTAQNSPQPSGDDGTPARESKPEETPSSGRAARGLRQAPPQRVIFQPDTGPTRPSNRQSSAQNPATPSASHTHGAQHSQHRTPSIPQSNGHMQAHGMGRLPPHQMTPGAQGQPSQTMAARGGASASYQPQNFEYHSSTVTAYQPPAVQSLALRPVETPANAPGKFAKIHPTPGASAPRQAPVRGSLPGQPSPFEGPNIYARCLYSLRCGIPAEEAFALHHLMKISYERGDRYKFEGFPGLAEGLVDVGLRVGSLFYDVNWTICYDPDADMNDISELDGIDGTSDILERIAQLQPRPPQDHFEPAEFADKMVVCSEAVMTIRNMLMLTENSRLMADFPPLRDLLCIILSLPSSNSTVELKHIALDIAEQLTPYLIVDAADPLYQSLLLQLRSVDRGSILTSLRALARISMNLSETNKLGGIPLDILELIIDWLMLNDDELLDACLDFLYQYTAVVPNLENLLSFRRSKPEKPESLVRHLARLLSHGAKQVSYTQTLKPEVKIPCNEEVAALPYDLQERLILMEEPERCYMWLRCLFEEDAESSITQIAIWTAYQSSFNSRLTQMGKSMISPADFIRNVTHVWATAGAQIIRGPKGENQKFIIKGIRARPRPVDPDNEGNEYFRCLWTLPGPKYQKCNLFFANAEKMFYHILSSHLNEKADDEGRYATKEGDYRCFWAGCQKFASPTNIHLSLLMKHVKTHLIAVQQNFEAPKPANATASEGEGALADDSGASPGANVPKRSRRPTVIPAQTFSFTNEETLTTRDERNPNLVQPAGIPLSAVLVLRNIARNVVKTEAQDELLKEQEKEGLDEKARGWNEKLFRAVLPRLHEVMTANRVMAPNLASLLELIQEQ